VPFWVFYALGDEYSRALDSIEDLNFSVAAEDENTEIVYLATEDEGLRKEIAVYFIPLLRPDETRSFKLYYEWPESFLKLLKTGTAKYDWYHRSYSETVNGNFYAEWVFDAALGQVQCKNTGSRPSGLHLTKADETPCRWILEGENVPLGNIHYQVTFWLENCD